MRQALAERLMLSEALDVVTALIERYPNGGAAAERGYIGGLAAVLVEYPASIARRAADPLKGVPKACRFLPTPADVIAWCEGEIADMRAPVAREDLDAKFARERAERREDAERWEKLRASPAGKYVADGLTSLANELRAGPAEADKRAHATHIQQLDKANRRTFERDCAAAGVDPERGVSPALLRQIEERREAEQREAAE